MGYPEQGGPISTYREPTDISREHGQNVTQVFKTGTQTFNMSREQLTNYFRKKFESLSSNKQRDKRLIVERGD